MKKGTSYSASRGHRRRSTHRNEPGKASNGRANGIGKAMLITAIAGVVSLLAAALGAYFCPDPATAAPLWGLGAAAGTALVCGAATVRLHGGPALLGGLVGGICLMLPMLLLSLTMTAFSSSYSAGISCLLHVALLLF